MCCFPIKRRTPPAPPQDIETLPVEELVPLPTPPSAPRLPKQRGSLRIPNFFYHLTPPTTPNSLNLPDDDDETVEGGTGDIKKEVDPFDRAYRSESTLTPPAITSSVTTLPLTPPTTPHLRALLVDDNPINLEILSRTLQLPQFSSLAIISAQSFTSPLQALAHLAEHDYDLILLDIDMPELSGVETAIAIRENTHGTIRPRNRKAPIVAVTTNDGPEARLRYMQAGMRACVGKPINIPELRKVIDEIVWALA